jgi:hypothetical protein
VGWLGVLGLSSVAGAAGGLAMGVFVLAIGPVRLELISEVDGQVVRAWLVNWQSLGGARRLVLRPAEKDPAQMTLLLDGTDVLSCEDQTLGALVRGVAVALGGGETVNEVLGEERCGLAPPGHLHVYEVGGLLVDEGICPGVFTGNIERQLHDAVYRPALSPYLDVEGVLEAPTISPTGRRNPPQGYEAAGDGHLDLMRVAWCDDEGVETNCLFPDGTDLFYCGRLRQDLMIAQPHGGRRRANSDDLVFSWLYMRARSFLTRDDDVSATCRDRPASLHLLAVASDVITASTVEAWSREQPRTRSEFEHRMDPERLKQHLAAKEDRVCVGFHNVGALEELFNERGVSVEGDESASLANSATWMRRVIEQGLAFPVFNALAEVPEGGGAKVSPAATGLKNLVSDARHDLWMPICFGASDRAEMSEHGNTSAAKASCVGRHQGVLGRLLGTAGAIQGEGTDLWRRILGSGIYRIDRQAITSGQTRAAGITLTRWESKETPDGAMPPFTTVSYSRREIEGGADPVPGLTESCKNNRYCVVTNHWRSDAELPAAGSNDGFCREQSGGDDDVSAVFLSSLPGNGMAACVRHLYRSFLTDPSGQAQLDVQEAILGVVGLADAAQPCFDRTGAENRMLKGYRRMGLLPGNVGIVPDIAAHLNDLSEVPAPEACSEITVVESAIEPWEDAATKLGQFAQRLGMQVQIKTDATSKDIDELVRNGTPVVLVSAAPAYSYSGFPTLYPLLDRQGAANRLKVSPLLGVCDQAYFDLYERGLTPKGGLPMRYDAGCQESEYNPFAVFTTRLTDLERRVWEGEGPLLPLVYLQPRWQVVAGERTSALERGLRVPAAFVRSAWPTGREP